MVIFDLNKRLEYMYKMWKENDDESFLEALTTPDNMGRTLFSFIVDRFRFISCISVELITSSLSSKENLELANFIIEKVLPVGTMVLIIGYHYNQIILFHLFKSEQKAHPNIRVKLLDRLLRNGWNPYIGVYFEPAALLFVEQLFRHRPFSRKTQIAENPGRGKPRSRKK